MQVHSGKGLIDVIVHYPVQDLQTLAYADDRPVNALIILVFAVLKDFFCGPVVLVLRAILRYDEQVTTCEHRSIDLAEKLVQLFVGQIVFDWH